MSQLHIAHVQGIFSPEHGGPTFSLANYCRGQVARGHQVSLRVLEGYPHSSPALRLEPPVDMGVDRVDRPARLGGSAAMRARLRADPTPEIYHLHGVWLRAMHYGAEEARRRGRPYVVELMGAYERYARLQKGLQKRVARWWFQDALLHQASCLHVNSEKEARELRELGFRVPIAVIPVGTDLGDANDDGGPRPSTDTPPHPAITEKRFVLYLARIHRNKGIELLINAWANVEKEFPDYRLVIAGSGTEEYVQACQRMIERGGLADSCLWLGQVSEEGKKWLYRHAECYVLPSYSENFGNTVAEALAAGTPVIITPNTVWTHLPREGCGWLSQTTDDSLTTTLTEALRTDPAQRQSMGRRGRQLIEDRYSSDKVIDQIDRLYRWLLGGPEPTDILFHG